MLSTLNLLLPRSCRFLVTLSFGLLALRASAQWTVVNLHPAGSPDSSAAYGVSLGQQAGFVGGHACHWSGTSASHVDLHPIGATQSRAYGSSAGQQVGEVNTIGDNLQRASLWTGTAASWVDLNPSVGIYGSNAYAVNNGQQVGAVWTGPSTMRASLWSGTAASWVDLTPVGSPSARANGVYNGVQVGWATVANTTHAGLWRGTSASWVDLHPPVALSSYAVAAGDGQQGGHCYILGANHASLWRGTPLSWVDLHPTGASSSEVMGVSAQQQVGYAIIGGSERASLWSGTANSWTDLHALLPAGYTRSYAYGIWSDGSQTYVVGWAHNPQIGTRAMLWKGPAPKPAVTILSAAMVKSNIFRVNVRGSWPGTRGKYRVKFTINGVPVEKLGAAYDISGNGTENIDIRLDEAGVPRFNNAMRFQVTVTPMLNGVAAGYNSYFSAHIPLPVLLVQGFFTDVSNPKLELLIKAFEAKGYRRDGPTANDYPTVKLIDETTANNYGYFPTIDRLEVNAGQLRDAITDFISPTSNKTYANRVDIVSHSKGGLVSRMYLKMYDPNGSTVRRLLMACSPHTGSLSATKSPLALTVLKELSPVDPWYRADTLGPFLASPPFPDWHNTTLIELNAWPMPVAPEYYILFGFGFNTSVNETMSPLIINRYNGDGVVTHPSQRGYHIINNQNGSVTLGPMIDGFAPIYPARMTFKLLEFAHTGFLDNARATVVDYISKPPAGQ